MLSVGQWPNKPFAWLLLFLGCSGLLAAALYFQMVLGLEPCVKCVYQRMAVVGIGLAAIVGLFGSGFWLTRWAALIGWLYSSYQGLLIAYDHWDLQTSKNAFFAMCESAPNFPGWAPLHEWMPGLFAAPGLCGDIDWQWLGLGMPGWMTVIFAGFLLIGIIVAVCHIIASFKKKDGLVLYHK